MIDKIRRHSGLRVLIALAAMIFCYGAANALTPAESFRKGKEAISKAKSLSANFVMKVSGQTVSGQIYSKGSKFAITSNATSSWYNGKSLYTYDPSANETYVFNPTQDELREANPLLYLNTSSGYDIKATKSKKKGVESLILIPKKASSVKSVAIDLDSKTFLPKTITIRPTSGAEITLTISGIKLNGNIGDGTFEYPKTKYPKAKVVDMR